MYLYLKVYSICFFPKCSSGMFYKLRRLVCAGVHHLVPSVSYPPPIFSIIQPASEKSLKVFYHHEKISVHYVYYLGVEETAVATQRLEHLNCVVLISRLRKFEKKNRYMAIF